MEGKGTAIGRERGEQDKETSPKRRRLKGVRIKRGGFANSRERREREEREERERGLFAGREKKETGGGEGVPLPPPSVASSLLRPPDREEGGGERRGLFRGRRKGVGKRAKVQQGVFLLAFLPIATTVKSKLDRKLEGFIVSDVYRSYRGIEDRSAPCLYCTAFISPRLVGAGSYENAHRHLPTPKAVFARITL